MTTHLCVVINPNYSFYPTINIWLIDVNTSVPDKKSMMMYVMCLFQSLPRESPNSNEAGEISETAASPMEVNGRGCK